MRLAAAASWRQHNSDQAGYCKTLRPVAILLSSTGSLLLMTAPTPVVFKKSTSAEP